MTTELPDDNLARRAVARRVLTAALAVPCHHHRVLIGEPCWTWPAAESDGECIGVCGHRRTAARADKRATAEGRALPRARRRGRYRAGRRA